jgi:hypothetical protein
MADEPNIYALIEALTPAQENALGHIAIGLDGMIHPRVVKALLAKGLIEEGTETLPGRVPVVVKRYAVPLHVHVVWCQWCSDHVTEEELAAIDKGGDLEPRANDPQVDSGSSIDPVGEAGTL